MFESPMWEINMCDFEERDVEKQSHDRTTKAPQNERGGRRNVQPTTTTPHSDPRERHRSEPRRKRGNLCQVQMRHRLARCRSCAGCVRDLDQHSQHATEFGGAIDQNNSTSVSRRRQIVDAAAPRSAPLPILQLLSGRRERRQFADIARIVLDDDGGFEIM